MTKSSLRTSSPEELSGEHFPAKLGLIAGSGNIPLLVASYAKKLGIPVVSILLSNENEEPMRKLSEKVFSLGVGQTGKILKALHGENVKDIVMIGKINKQVIYNKRALDLRALKVLTLMKMRDDTSFMNAIFSEFAKEGIRVLPQTLFLKEHMPDAGVLGRKKPSKSQLMDIQFGFPIAKKLAGMEIGQTIVVKDKSVVAVESMEGSDNAISRGCKIAGSGAVIIKVSRPNQDWRFDVPTIGLRTIQTAVEGNASVLAMESDRMLFVEQEEGLKLADSKKLVVAAHSCEDFT